MSNLNYNSWTPVLHFRLYYVITEGAPANNNALKLLHENGMQRLSWLQDMQGVVCERIVGKAFIQSYNVVFSCKTSYMEQLHA